MKIKVSAPGKLMLLGEHAVVYDNPCLVTAVDKRLYVEAEIIDSNEDEIVTPQVKESRFVFESIVHFKERFSIKKTVKITTKGDFSHSVGLGSSSAVTVATFKALSALFDLPLSLREIFDLSYRVNLEIQGLGSGFDIAAATYGRTIYFITGGKVIESFDINKHSLVVGYSGIKADTPFYVRKVAEAFKYRKKEMGNIFSKITELVNTGHKEIKNNNLADFGRLMTTNHRLLQELCVSIPKLDVMVEAALSAGALGAKLSGAGGGDCMIALTKKEDIESVEKAIIKTQGEIIKVDINAEGVRVEK